MALISQTPNFFSDGSRDDVTQYALYSSNDEAIAAVSETGDFTVLAAGETGLTARYMGHFRTARVGMPFSGDKAEIARTLGKPASFIDRLIADNLLRLRILPSPTCTDAEFLRRAQLDILGTLPRIEEARAFAADTRPDKRARLVEALLERPEFGDYWSLWLLDLFRVKAKTVGEKNVEVFPQWIKEQLRADTAFGDIARQVLTAVGDGTRIAPVNYLRQTNDPKLLSELTTEALMGSSSRCAQCHNHPFDSWTQTQYHQMVAFFVRVDRTENGTMLADHGEIEHPKTGKPVAPGFPGGTSARSKESDRRIALADWLVSPENTFFARSIANRVWARLMGRGIIAPVDNLTVSNAPTNPELLEALSDFFKGRLESQPSSPYSLKSLIRTILASQAYQRSAQPNSISRLGALDPAALARAGRDPDSAVRVHAMRILAAKGALDEAGRALAVEGTRDPEPFVQRAAAEVLRLHPHASQVEPLLELRARIPAEDTHLVYAVRMALRDQLRDAEIFAGVARRQWPEREAGLLADALVGVESAGAALFLLDQLQREQEAPERFIAHAARLAPEASLDRLIEVVRPLGRGDARRQATYYKALDQGFRERTRPLPAAARSWGASLVDPLLVSGKAEDQRLAFEIAGSVRWAPLEGRLSQAFAARALPVETRMAAADALIAINPARHLALIGSVLRDPAEKFEFQIRALQALRRADLPAANAQLVAALRVAPMRLQQRLVAALLQSEDAAKALLEALEQGKGPRQLLLRTGMQSRLRSLSPEIRARAARITEGLEAGEESMEGVIEQRKATFHSATRSAATGARVFEKFCMSCHQLGGRGKTVGPQLDGIGNRGLERLIEDVLDPNRNVESGFRSRIVKMRNGSTIAGMVVAEKREGLVMVGESGEEVRIPRGDIVSERASQLSPMPSDFAEQIPAEDFNHLLAFLLGVRPEEK